MTVKITINGKPIKSMDDIAPLVEKANKEIKPMHEAASKKGAKPYDGATEEFRGAITKAFQFHPWHAFAVGLALGNEGVNFD